MIWLSKYIKFGVYGVFFLAIIVVYVKCKTLSAENARLNAQLAQSAVQISMQSNVISQISDEREYMNSLLINRAASSAQNEENLRNEIKQIQAEMRNSTCVIPASVTEQLRQQY
ncbi:hypothetical protein [Vibrio quintilis]|uniref:DUF2570 domain-containing protein n=1 Tax=Vibrio quintilis TaxID=1117707 RepID=A0A1M7YP40_9VIBR|nr:hypothetical protein [Vibrio quintilis]SHO54397.1 hypothetical protein VQ7734_00111 [Vibrio quintilis]